MGKLFSKAKVADKVEPSQVLVYVPSSGRKCHDVEWCILFIAFWVGMLAIGFIGFSTGDGYRLLYPTDYNGDTCGVEGRGKWGYFAQINEDLWDAYTNGILPNNPGEFTPLIVCTDACPETGTIFKTADQSGYPDDAEGDWYVAMNVTSLFYRSSHCQVQKRRNLTRSALTTRRVALEMQPQLSTVQVQMMKTMMIV